MDHVLVRTRIGFSPSEDQCSALIPLLSAFCRAVNALFWVVEFVGDTVISWVPFYLEAKIVALAWLVLPSYRGSLLLHQRWLAPAFEQHEEAIDHTIADFKRRAGEKMVQVCKDTAVIALRNSSDVVAQSQHYMAAQLVQQALGKLQPAITADAEAPPSDSLRLPSLLPFLSGVVSGSSSDTTVGSKQDSQAEEKPIRRSTKSKEQEKPTPPSTRSEKTKQVLDHFKKLLVKGFQLKYYPSNGAVKNRALLLDSVTSRCVSFVSASDVATATSDSKRKSARLLLLNLRRVSSSVAEESAIYAKMVDDETLDDTRSFVLDNGKAVMLFEAESQKSRDLLVAGMRLLITEHKKRDTAVLTQLCSALERLLVHQAFDQLYASSRDRQQRMRK
ncbi:hypothetical protein BBJ28_00007807 [Nothophytophthora sp. Chile5]|nr:hypothetical protein BBJ28_00007807 [Nothophytophthora sp. Chile5]